MSHANVKNVGYQHQFSAHGLLCHAMAIFSLDGRPPERYPAQVGHMVSQRMLPLPAKLSLRESWPGILQISMILKSLRWKTP
jgi:hypothetical protein